MFMLTDWVTKHSAGDARTGPYVPCGRVYPWHGVQSLPQNRNQCSSCCWRNKCPSRRFYSC